MFVYVKCIPASAAMFFQVVVVQIVNTAGPGCIFLQV
jgi:hypothetical protein